MNDTPNPEAEVRAAFQRLSVDSGAVARFVFRCSEAFPGNKTLFVGNLFDVAGKLHESGLDVTVVDSSDEMVAIGRARSPGYAIEKADLRELAYDAEFDLMVVVGRVFTHFTTEEDLRSAIASCRMALKPGGKLFFDNYENDKIDGAEYFNGQLEVSDGADRIVRIATSESISEDPKVVRWDADYEGEYQGQHFEFQDVMELRAFSRPEIAGYLPRGGFQLISQGNGFDDISFYTLAERLKL